MGCSWTYGIGVHYQPSMTSEQYLRISDADPACDQLSWRGQLCQRLGYHNHNLSQGGSSNKKQFRLAQEFFISPTWHRMRDQYQHVRVIWGITSTARTEMFSLECNQLHDFFLSEGCDYAKFLISNCYDHEHEVYQLRNLMLHWNDHFRSQGVINHWFDTFNTHHYSRVTPWSHPGLTQAHYESVCGSDWPTWHQLCHEDLGSFPQPVLDELAVTFDINVRNIDGLV
jgi:hypothetical protein